MQNETKQTKIMKTLLMTIGLVLSYTASAQWVSKTVDNGLDDPYKIAYTESGGRFLKLENIDGKILFYLDGGYTCEERVNVDLSFMVKGEYKKYSFYAVTSEDSKAVFMMTNLLTQDCLEDFKASTTVKMRVNDVTCGAEIYEFKMSGSTAALNFMSK